MKLIAAISKIQLHEHEKHWELRLVTHWQVKWVQAVFESSKSYGICRIPIGLL